MPIGTSRITLSVALRGLVGGRPLIVSSANMHCCEIILKNINTNAVIHIKYCIEENLTGFDHFQRLKAHYNGACIVERICRFWGQNVNLHIFAMYPLLQVGQEKEEKEVV